MLADAYKLTPEQERENKMINEKIDGIAALLNGLSREQAKKILEEASKTIDYHSIVIIKQ